MTLDRTLQDARTRHWEIQFARLQERRAVLLVEGPSDLEFLERALRAARDDTTVGVVALGGRRQVIRALEERCLPGMRRFNATTRVAGLVDLDLDPPEPRPDLFVTRGWCIENDVLAAVTPTECPIHYLAWSVDLSNAVDAELPRSAWFRVVHRAREDHLQNKPEPGGPPHDFSRPELVRALTGSSWPDPEGLADSVLASIEEARGLEPGDRLRWVRGKAVFAALRGEHLDALENAAPRALPAHEPYRSLFQHLMGGS